MAWIIKPMITVMTYMPSWPPICVRSSISTIFPAIRNRIPIGAYLTEEEEHWVIEETCDGDICFNKKLLPLRMNSYHMMMATSRMIASLRLSKKSLRSWPCSFMLPIIRPKHMEKTTSPRALTPFTWPGTGIASSRVISMTSWVALVELKRVSFTVTVTWTTRLPYLVLNWRMKELEDQG